MEMEIASPVTARIDLLPGFFFSYPVRTGMIMKTLSKLNQRRFEVGSARSGFTLIEILIVVILLGILAAMVIPKFTNATEETKENMLRENLRVLKAQIGTYRAQHWDVPPGYPDGDTSAAPTEADFIAQLTQYTDEYGATNAVQTPVFKYGPYMREIPENPINSESAIEIINDGGGLPGAGDDSHGWIFRPEDLTLLADAAGNDSHGDDYYEY